MKIEYKFVDGTVTEIEVDGSLWEFMLELKKEGDRVERKETRRHMSLDSMDFEGELFASAEDTEKTAMQKGAAAGCPGRRISPRRRRRF